MVQQYNGFVSEEFSSKSLKDRLSPYTAAWPFFLSSIVVCLACGVFYLRYSIPKYEARTVFLVKNSEQAKPSSDDIINDVLDGKRQVNLNNEVMLVTSRRLMERTVKKHGFNIAYFLKGRLHSIDIYKEAPFVLNPIQLTDSNKTYQIAITEIDSGEWRKEIWEWSRSYGRSRTCP